MFPKRPVILILVIGPTGSGKTTFINLLCDSNLQVGYSLESCTTSLQVAEAYIEGQKVSIIDTPGFDDTEKPQAEVFMQIATFLERIYRRRHRIAGVIYMHRITDNRMNGVSMENFRLFQKICGPEAMNNAFIVTNMWSSIHPDVGAQREYELRNFFFREALEYGARMRRHDDTRQSAQRIVLEMLGNRPHVLQVQEEMVVQQRSLLDTTAGEELRSDLDRRAHRLRQELQELGDKIDVMRTATADDWTHLRALRNKLNGVLREMEKLGRNLHVQRTGVAALVTRLLERSSVDSNTDAYPQNLPVSPPVLYLPALLPNELSTLLSTSPPPSPTRPPPRLSSYSLEHREARPPSDSPSHPRALSPPDEYLGGCCSSCTMQ